MSFFCISLFRKKGSRRRPLEEWNQEHRNLVHVPAEPLAHPETMRVLRLNANRIRELPKAVFNLQLLTHLNLSDNDIPYLPPGISRLVNLEYLDLSKNSLGEIPPIIYNCKELTYLDFSTNPLGRLPDSMTALVNVRTLLLNDICLESLPVNLGRMQKLVVLELRENCLNELPESMARLIYLERLDLGCNEFYVLPPLIGNLISIKELWLDINLLSELPPELGRLREMQFLELSENRLEVLPAEMGNLIGLQDCYLSENLLTDLPETFGGMCNLTILKAEKNRLRRLPISIGRLEELSELSLTSNSLQDLPHGIGCLKKLSVLSVDENDLMYIPPQLGNCRKLTVLSLRDNQLVSLPNEIGYLQNLTVLNLVGNRLQWLPYSLTSLRHLSAIWLSKDQSKPMVDLQSERSTNGHLVLTCVLFPQQELDETSRFIALSPGDDSVLHSPSTSGARRRSSTIAFINIVDDKAQKDSIAYPKEVHSKMMQRRTSKDMGDGKSPKHIIASPHRDSTDAVRLRNRDHNRSINRPYSFLKALNDNEVPTSPTQLQGDRHLSKLSEETINAQSTDRLLGNTANDVHMDSNTYHTSNTMTSDSGVTDIDQPFLTPPKMVASPNWFDTSTIISHQPAPQQGQNVTNCVSSGGQGYNPHQITEEEKVHLLTQTYLAGSQESTESAHHYKQALSNNFDSPAINTNNSGHSGADALHGAVPYRVRSRDNMLQFSPSPEGFQNNTNVLKLHQRVPSAPTQRIQTQFNHNNNPTMHIRQRSADLIGDNMDQVFFPPHGRHSDPNFDMHIEPDWYLSPNSKPKYQKTNVPPVNNAPQSYMMDWMLRRSESPNRLNVVQSYSGRSTPVRHFQYPLVGNSGGSAVQFVRTNTPTPRIPALEGKVMTIELRKNPTLGISITGGINGENLCHPGDPSLYVYDMAEGKPAKASGQIQIGDKILSVNGHDVTNVTHEEAASLLQSSSTRVVLQIYRDPSETLL